MLTLEKFGELKCLLNIPMKQNSDNLLSRYSVIKQILHSHQKDISEYNRSNAPEWNIYRILGVERYEVIFHTLLLAELISPRGRHGQGGLFLTSFLRMIGSLSEYEVTHPSWYVRRETESIDLRIGNDVLHKAVFIENKIDTDAHDGQLSRYYVLWKEQYPNGGVFSYLTINGNSPSDSGFDTPQSRAEVEATPLKLLSYKKDIQPWLANIVDRIEPQKLKQSVVQYIQTINNL